MFGPMIEGERVRLVPITVEMAPLFCTWLADAEVTRYLGRYQTVGIARHDLWRFGQWHDAWLGEVLRDDWLARQ
ncbi:MAG: hypothetical protein NTX57_22825 [Armatimonadetes bacterium]|nr:hypothetical protein [Armatimonadota bacterium]